MPDLEAEAKAAVGWAEEHIPGHRKTSAAQPAATATIRTSTPGGPVSLAADLQNFGKRLEAIGEEAVSDFETIKATPVGGEVISIIAKLAQNEAAAILPAGVMSNLHATLKGIESLALPYIAAFEQQQAQAAQQAAGDPQPSFTPAGPQVGGQA